MKKTFSLVMVLIMLFSLGLSVFAEGEKSTEVIYIGHGSESYEVRVPSSLTVKDEGEAVKGYIEVEGAWASNRILTVTAPNSVTLINTIDANDQKELAVTFEGIAQTGSNTDEIYIIKEISVANISNALFGNWVGSISYTISMDDVT